MTAPWIVRVNNGAGNDTVGPMTPPSGGAWTAQANATTFWRVWDNSGTYEAVNMNTGATDYSSATCSAVLNDLIALQSGTANVVIQLDPNIVVDAGAVTINKPNITIYSEHFSSPNDQSPIIPNLVWNDSATQIQRVYLFGLVIYTETYNLGGYGVSFCLHQNCSFIAKNGNSAIVVNYNTNGTGNGAQYVKYLSCWFNEQNVAASTPPALWQHTATGTNAGQGHWELVSCSYVSQSATSTAPLYFCRFTGPINSGPMLFNIVDFDFVSENQSATEYTYVFFSDLSVAGSQNSSVIMSNVYIETGTAAKKLVVLWGFGGSTGSTNSSIVARLVYVNGNYFYALDGTPVVVASKDSGLDIECINPTKNLTGQTSYVTTYMNLATGTIAQGTAATNPTFGNMGQGVSAWRIRVRGGSGPAGFTVTTPPSPNAGVRLANLYPFPVDVIVTAVGTAGAATVTDFDGTATVLGVPSVGTTYRLNVGEQITFATAWPTVVWRGV